MLKEAERYTRERLTQDWQAECKRWEDRALRAEAELHRCYKDMQELLAERTDLKAMLADAGVRNAVLEKRLDYLTKVLVGAERCPNDDIPASSACVEAEDCWVCWQDWLEREVQL